MTQWSAIPGESPALSFHRHRPAPPQSVLDGHLGRKGPQAPLEATRLCPAAQVWGAGAGHLSLGEAAWRLTTPLTPPSLSVFPTTPFVIPGDLAVTGIWSRGHPLSRWSSE